MNTRRQIVNQEDAGSVIKNITRPFCQNGNAIMDGKFENKTKTMGTVFNASTTIYPTVIAIVNGEKPRIMVDTGAEISNICTNLLTKLKLKPTRKEHKSIEQLYGTVDNCVEIYNLTLELITILEFASRSIAPIWKRIY